MDLAPPPLPSRQNRSPSFDAPRPDFGSAPPLPQRPHDPNVYNQPQYNAYNNVAPYNNNYNAGMPVYQNNPPIPYHNNVHNNSAPLPYQNTPQFNNMPPPIPYHNQPPPNNFPTAIPAQQHPPQIPPHVAMPPQQVIINAPIINDYSPMQSNTYQVPAPFVQPQQPKQIQQPNAMPAPYANNNLNVNNMNGVAPPPIAHRASVSTPGQPPKGGFALPMAPKKMPPKMAPQPQQPSPNGVNDTSPSPMPSLAQPTPNDAPPRVSPRGSVPPRMVNPNFPQPQPESERASPQPIQAVPNEAPTTTTIIMPARPKAQSVSVPKGQPNGGPPKGAVKKQPIIAGQPKTSQQLGPPPVTRQRSTTTGDAPSTVVVPTIRLDAVNNESSAPPLPARPVSDNNRFESPQPYTSSSPVAINSPYTYVAVPQKESGTKVELVDSTYNKSPNDIKVPRKASTEKPHSPHKIHSIYEVVDEIRTDKVKGGYTAQIVEIEERGDLMDSKKKKVKMYKVAVTKGGVSWTIYRRYDQFFEFDKKLKSKKLLPSDDTWLPSKKMFLNSEEKNQLAIERFGQLNKYMEHILSAKIIQESDVLWMFIEPTQLGDVKPEKK